MKPPNPPSSLVSLVPRAGQVLLQQEHVLHSTLFLLRGYVDIGQQAGCWRAWVGGCGGPGLCWQQLLRLRGQRSAGGKVLAGLLPLPHCRGWCRGWCHSSGAGAHLACSAYRARCAHIASCVTHALRLQVSGTGCVQGVLLDTVGPKEHFAELALLPVPHGLGKEVRWADGAAAAGWEGATGRR